MNRLPSDARNQPLGNFERDSTEEWSGEYLSAANGPVEFKFPTGWFKNEESNPYDLQVLSEHQRMNTGVFLYGAEDLTEEHDPIDLLEQQIDDLDSKRKNFKEVEEEKVVRLEGKTLTTVVYSGEEGSSRHFYKFTLVEFTANPELMVVLLQVSIPSYWATNKSVLEAIAASGRIWTQSPQDHRGLN